MKGILLTSCVFMCCLPVLAQQQTDDSVRTEVLNEIVFSATRFEEDRKNVSQHIEVVPLQQIKNLNLQSSADLLIASGAVSVQKSQQGGGSPVLRGFEANRVLLVVDGIRMNNLIYRAGHLQNVVTVDNNMIEQLEVLFGPASTAYGSDALGGVIHFRTFDPKFSSPEAGTIVSGNGFIRLGTVNNEKTGHFDFNIGGKKIASLTSFTYSSYGDLRMGEKTNPSFGMQYGLREQYVVRASDNQSDVLITNDDPYLQRFSGYDQYDLLQKVSFKPSNSVQHGLNIQYSTSTNVPRYDRLTDPDGGGGLRSAEWYYGPQERLLAAYMLNVDQVGKYYDHLKATISYQSIEESRHNRRFNNNSRRSQIENVGVIGVTMDAMKKKGKHTLRYGIDGQFNWVTSTAFAKDITTGMKSPFETRYPDGNNELQQISIYGTHSLQISENVTLNDGFRIGRSMLHSTFDDKSFFPFPFDDVDQQNTITSANLGLVFAPENWKISVMGSIGYRVPNIDDLSKVFESTPGIIIVPNPNVKPEKTLNLDVNITRKVGSVLYFENVFYVTRLFDAIVVDNFTFNGQSTIDYDGTPSQVMASQNRQKGYIRGYNGTLKIQPVKQFIMSSTFNYTYGRVRENSEEQPLDHVPPAFGRISLQYKSRKLYSEVFSIFNGWKKLEDYSDSGEDNLQYATSEGMPSWYTINLRLGYELNQLLTLQAGVDNLFDLQYRMFASGINSPGRNFFGTIRVKF